MMKNAIKIGVGIVSIIILLFFYIVIQYQKTNASYYQVLSSQIPANQVKERLGKPIYIITDFKKMKYEGWKLPTHIPEKTKEIWVYGNITGRRFYVFVSNEEQQPILSFFSSQS